MKTRKESDIRINKNKHITLMTQEEYNKIVNDIDESNIEKDKEEEKSELPYLENTSFKRTKKVKPIDKMEENDKEEVI